ncbi:MAG: glycosyltransferase family 4 protein [Bacillota bacterium]
MKIGINIIPLRSGKVGGIEIYIRDLISHLLLLDKNNEYVLFTANYNHDTFDEQSRLKKVLAHSELVNKSKASKLLSTLPQGFVQRLRRAKNDKKSISLTDLIIENKIDLLFCPFGNLEPRPIHIPSVITIHDLQHVYFPEFFSAQELEHRKKFYPESCQAATRIIAISNFTKDTIIDNYNIPTKKIRTIWEAQGEQFNSEISSIDTGDIKINYNLPDNFAFFPANIWPHKNHVNLILAFAHYKQLTGREKFLVLTGASLEGRKKIDALIRELNLQNSVYVLGYIPRHDLLGLYLLADYLVFPSLFEGFGIPIVEAMACGCPVLASNAASLPEIVGDAGIFFDPKSPKSIVDSMLYFESSAIIRENLVQKGLARCKVFSYAKTAAETLEVFQEAYNSRETKDFAFATGIAADAWLTEPAIFKVVFQKEIKEIQLEGELPGIDLIFPQEVEVQVNGQIVKKLVIDTTEQFEFSIKGDFVPGKHYAIKIIPSKWFIPNQIGIPDNRRLAMKINKFNSVSNNTKTCIWEM